MFLRLKEIIAANVLLALCIFIIFIANILLLFFPLTNVFGFEFSFVNAVLITFLSGLISISYFKKNSDKSEVNNKSFKTFTRIGIILLLIPLVISLTNSLLGSACSLADGFLFYLALTVPSYIIGLALGLAAFSISKKLPVLIYLIIFFLILLIPLIEFYVNPQIYFFNPIFGFLPGTIYDEGLSVSLKLVLYRSANLIFFLTVFLILFKFHFINKDKLKKNIILASSLILALIFIAISPSLGLSTTKSSLVKDLNKKVVTEHFIIHYSGEIEESEIKIITLHHEYYYSKLSKYFNVEADKKIESFIFKNNSEKGRLFGSANADVAKPWLQQIYTTKDSYNKTLEHEIGHIFSASFGSGIFKVADGLNPSLIEGIAVAGSPYYDGYPIDYMASLAWKNGYRVNIGSLFSGVSFFGQTSSISYIYAGSYSKYLIDNYGMSKFKLFYKDADFTKIYDLPLKDVTDKYYNYLATINTKGDGSKANYYFGRRTIFQKVCPRHVADRLKDAAAEFAEHNFEKSFKIYSEILSKINNYYALIGYAEVSKKLNDTLKGLNKIEYKLKDFINTSYYYNLQFKLADLYSLSKRTLQADSLYKEIINEKPNIRLEHLSSLRLILLNSPGQLNLYLNGSSTDKLVLLLKLIDKNNADIILPVAVRLSEIIDLEYELFIKNFISDEIAANLKDSYTLNIVSMYMLDNFDFKNAKIMIEKAARISNGKFNNKFIKDNQDKINWMSDNFDPIVNLLRVYNNQ